jgi:hypothetical protein
MRRTFALARNEAQTQVVAGIARSQSWQAKSATTETAFGRSAAFDFGKTPIFPPAPTPATRTRESNAPDRGNPLREPPESWW